MPSAVATTQRAPGAVGAEANAVSAPAAVTRAVVSVASRAEATSSRPGAGLQAAHRLAVAREVLRDGAVGASDEQQAPPGVERQAARPLAADWSPGVVTQSSRVVGT